MSDYKTQFYDPHVAAMQGHQQFISQKRKMLDAFDRAREEAHSHKVETYHGRVAEAEFRRWLTDFLPKKYGVTSGYIVSQAHFASSKLPEYDVIIYDALESPILWIEENRDASSQGWKRAIPAEHVRVVIEVKSSFSSKTVRDAIAHLSELEPLLAGQVDLIVSKVRTVHPIHTAACFFELRRENEKNRAALNGFVDAYKIPGFTLATILRGEGRPSDQSASLDIGSNVDVNRQPIAVQSTLAEEGSTLLNKQFSMGDSQLFPDGDHVNSTLMWGVTNFAYFAFDLLALLNGTYSPGSVSSGFGLIFSDTRPNRDQVDT